MPVLPRISGDQAITEFKRLGFLKIGKEEAMLLCAGETQDVSPQGTSNLHEKQSERWADEDRSSVHSLKFLYFRAMSPKSSRSECVAIRSKC